MRAGDYVRTKNGYICKIININDFREPSMKYSVDVNYLKDIVFIRDEDILKSSPNIIDLIEVGDILKFKDDKNYEEVQYIDKDKIYLTDFIYYSGLQEYKEEMQQDMEWVITHEQIENIKYEVE